MIVTFPPDVVAMGRIRRQQADAEAEAGRPLPIEQIDVVPCEDGETMMLYAWTADDHTFCATFVPEPSCGH